jgi:tRNA threonylcarbamoyladenosine biosynthesis protein TsaE
VPDSQAHTVLLVTHSPEHTQQFGERLGRLIQPGDVICLSGELGAGKTTLAIGIGRGWGALETVNSPTFVLVNAYSRLDGNRLYHIDAYRLRDAADAESIALPDLLSEPESALLIEWPERVVDALPTERLWLTLQWQDEAQRSIEMTGLGARYIALAQAIRVGYDSGN